MTHEESNGLTPTKRFQVRVCEKCGKAGSTMAFRLPDSGTRGYFHPKCFRNLSERKRCKPPRSG